MAPTQRHPLLLLATLLFCTISRTRAVDWPHCISDCITSSNSGCDAEDICTTSEGGCLPEMLFCIYKTCPKKISVGDLLEPLEKVCRFVGDPIPTEAIQSAETAAAPETSAVTSTESTLRAEQTDSSPFATSGGQRELGSTLGAVLCLAAALALGC